MPEDQPYVDPSDLQFGKAAQEKEETVDALLERGENPAELDEGDPDTQPRPGNKAPVDTPDADN